MVGTWVIANVWALFGKLGFISAPDPDQIGGLHAVAFSIGVFPAIAWAYVQGLTKKLLNAGAIVPSLKTQLPIRDLDGLTGGAADVRNPHGLSIRQGLRGSSDARRLEERDR